MEFEDEDKEIEAEYYRIWSSGECKFKEKEFEIIRCEGQYTLFVESPKRDYGYQGLATFPRLWAAVAFMEDEYAELPEELVPEEIK